MNFKISLFFTLCTAVVTLFAIISSTSSLPSSPAVKDSSFNVAKLSQAEIAHIADMSLLQFMTQSRVASSAAGAAPLGPQDTLACFDYYVPVLNQTATDFGNKYAECVKKATDERDELNGSKQSEREEIAGTAQNSCAALDSCNVLQGVEEYFECYANVAKNNSQIMRNLSSDATNELLKVRYDLAFIDINENLCLNTAKTEHDTKTAEIYEEFQDCLSGKIPVPTTVATTATPADTTPMETTTPEGTTTDISSESQEGSGSSEETKASASDGSKESVELLSLEEV